MVAICPQCEEPREVKRKPRGCVLCRPCKSKNATGIPLKPDKTQAYRICKTCGDKLKIAGNIDTIDKDCMDCYKKQAEGRVRICIDCGDEKEVESLRDMKSIRCHECNQKEQGRLRIGRQHKKPKIRYYVFCGKCPSVRIATVKSGSNLCQSCARSNPRKLQTKIFFDLDSMSIIYIESEAMMMRRLKKLKPPRAIKHKVVKPKRVKKIRVTKPKRTKARKIPKKKDIQNSPEFIAKQREVNKAHKKSVEETKNKVVVEQKHTDEELIAKFYKSGNKPSVIDNVKVIPHMVGVNANCSNSSYLS